MELIRWMQIRWRRPQNKKLDKSKTMLYLLSLNTRVLAHQNKKGERLIESTLTHKFLQKLLLTIHSCTVGRRH